MSIYTPAVQAMPVRGNRLHDGSPLFQNLQCIQVQEQRGLDGDEHNHRTAALEAIVQFYDVLGEAGHVLDDGQLARAINAADAFLLHQNALSMHFWHLKIKLYNVTFKSHLFWHLARQCKWFNPKHGWAFRDESFVGAVARIVKTVVFGSGAWGSGTSLATKWRHLQWFRLRRREGAVFA